MPHYLFPLKFCDGSGLKKIDYARARLSKNFNDMSIRLDTVLALDRRTEGRTDRQTDRQTEMS